jgi:CMP/dCMP kinase
MIITIAGAPGSGKSTVGKLLAEKLKYRYYSMGDVWRMAAKEVGSELNAFYEHGRRDPTFNKKLDELQQQLGQQDGTIIDSRMGFHFLPGALKIYLNVNEMVGANRILMASRDDEAFTSHDDALQKTRMRKETESSFYYELYHVDPHDLNNFDVVIDTTHITPQETVQKILTHIGLKI